METDRKNFIEVGLKIKEEKKRAIKEKEDFRFGKRGTPRDTMTVWIRIHRAWMAELLRIGAEWTLRDEGTERMKPWSPSDLIRYAIAKTFFLRSGEPITKFAEEWTSHSKRFI